MLTFIVYLQLTLAQVGLPYFPTYGPVPPRNSVPIELRTIPTRVRV